MATVKECCRSEVLGNSGDRHAGLLTIVTPLHPTLGHDSFEVAFTCEAKELLSRQFHVIAVEQPFSYSWNYAAQPVLAILQGKVTQIFAIAREQIECLEAWLISTEQQIRELRIASIVQPDDLSIQGGTFGTAFESELTVLRLFAIGPKYPPMS
jgi:hypothetical protein